MFSVVLVADRIMMLNLALDVLADRQGTKNYKSFSLLREREEDGGNGDMILKPWEGRH